MTVLPIVTDLAALRVKSAPVTVFDEDLRQLAADMIDTVWANEGAGLAAVQVGVPMRVIVVKTMDGSYRVMVNPRLVGPVGKPQAEAVEGCLSLPGAAVVVRRHQHVTVAYREQHGFRVSRPYSGHIARVIQHELDHLNGVLITDYALEGAR